MSMTTHSSGHDLLYCTKKFSKNLTYNAALFSTLLPPIKTTNTQTNKKLTKS